MPDTFVANLVSRLAIASIEFFFVGVLAALVLAVFPSIAPRWRRVIWLLVLCKPIVTLATSFLGGVVPLPSALTGQMLGDVLFPKAHEGLLASTGTAGKVLHLMAASWIIVTGVLLIRAWLRAVTSARLIDESLQKGYLLKPRSLRLLDPRLEVPSHVRVIITPEDAGPATIGVLRPAVIIPDYLLPWVNQHRDPTPRERARLCQVLRHELAHVANRDALYSFLATLLVSLFWFHPLAHWAYRRVRLNNELCCDESVVDSGVNAAEYAETLMNVVAGEFARRSFSMSILGDVSPRAVLRSRLQYLLNSRKRAQGRRPVAAFATIALLILTMPRYLADAKTQMIHLVSPLGELILVSVEVVHLYPGYLQVAEGEDQHRVLAAQAAAAEQLASNVAEAAKSLGRLAGLTPAETEPTAPAGPVRPRTEGEILAQATDNVAESTEREGPPSPSRRRSFPLEPPVPGDTESPPILPPPPIR
jgi:beta-lactamase regulating signal transducer with metallopeptidase domain